MSTWLFHCTQLHNTHYTVSGPESWTTRFRSSESSLERLSRAWAVNRYTVRRWNIADDRWQMMDGNIVRSRPWDSTDGLNTRPKMVSIQLNISLLIMLRFMNFVWMHSEIISLRFEMKLGLRWPWHDLDPSLIMSLMMWCGVGWWFVWEIGSSHHWNLVTLRLELKLI